MSKPLPNTYPAYFNNYISLVPDSELPLAFENQQTLVESFFDTISEDQSSKAYAEGKWTLKELLQHLIDTERIFNYRSLAFARKETAALPGFDENVYAENSFANDRSWASLVEEIKAVRAATILMFQSFTADMLNYSGMANGNPNSANAMGFTSIGHLYHHINIIKERYL